MVGSTHGPAGGGSPRLIFAMGGQALVSDGGGPLPQLEFALAAEVSVIGSDAGADLRLDDVAGRQAQVVHEDSDEYVLISLTEVPPTLVNGQPVERSVLRTGDRVEIGPHTLSFMRAEEADHGRPHGGRQGGEGSHQQPQAPRSQSTAAREPDASELTTRPAEPSP